MDEKKRSVDATKPPGETEALSRTAKHARNKGKHEEESDGPCSVRAPSNCADNTSSTNRSTVKAGHSSGSWLKTVILFVLRTRAQNLQLFRHLNWSTQEFTWSCTHEGVPSFDWMCLGEAWAFSHVHLTCHCFSETSPFLQRVRETEF
jgi:hypothetical protein